MRCKKKYSDHNFTCASIVKKNKKAKQKDAKNKKKDCACKDSKKFLQGWRSIIDTWDCSSYCTQIQIKLIFFPLHFTEGIIP